MDTDTAPVAPGGHAEHVALIMDRHRAEQVDHLGEAVAGIRDGIIQLARDATAEPDNEVELLDTLRALLVAYDRVRDVQDHIDSEPDWREYVESSVDEYPPLVAADSPVDAPAKAGG